MVKKKRTVRLRKKRGKIRNATPTTSRDGVKFRSKLELYTYNKLKEANIKDFLYEEEKFVLMEGFTFENDSVEDFESKVGGVKTKFFDNVVPNIRSITYLPDFTNINHKTKTGWIIECKGYSNDAFPLKWKMFKRWLTDRGYKVDLYKPNNQKNVLKCIELIKEKYG